VSEFIVATIPAREVPDPAAPLAHLLDADLSIFAAAPHRYEQYAVAVRAEYAHVPEADFAAGRSRILSSYLAQPAIYRTGAAQLLWERRARQNVSAEVERLRG
jgi:predicted metal-dependent HD superfamily phosphohydrolase